MWLVKYFVIQHSIHEIKCLFSHFKFLGINDYVDSRTTKFGKIIGELLNFGENSFIKTRIISKGNNINKRTFFNKKVELEVILFT